MQHRRRLDAIEAKLAPSGRPFWFAPMLDALDLTPEQVETRCAEIRARALAHGWRPGDGPYVVVVDCVTRDDTEAQ